MQEDLLKRANEHAWHGTPLDAIPLYDEYLREDSLCAEAYAFRGFAYRRLGNIEQCLRDCAMAIQLDPTYAMAHVIRGSTYRQTGDLIRALKDYTQAIEINSSYAAAYANRGLTHEELGNYCLLYTSDAADE